MVSAALVTSPRNKTAKYYIKSAIQRGLSQAIRATGISNKKPAHGAYIDIGAGKNQHDHLFSIDYAWVPGLDMVHDVTKGLPFQSETIGGIFTEHCMEHIALAQFVGIAKEFHRVLMPDRIARIVVPDGRIYIDHYLEAQSGNPVNMPGHDEDGGYPFYTPMMSVNRIMRAHGHQFIYDFETMKAILLHAGFREVTQRQFRVGGDPKLLVDLEFRKPESLYVEARK